MKKLLFISVMAAGLTAPSLSADNIAYGILGFWHDDNRTLTNHIVTFPLQAGDYTPSMYTDAIPFYQSSTAGAYAAGSYYMATCSDSDDMTPTALLKFDLGDGSYATVGDISGIDGYIADMTFDNKRNTMWLVSYKDINNPSGLYTISLSDASVTHIADFDRRFRTIAATYDGNIYGIDGLGTLFEIQADGSLREIGPTGFLPNTIQTMEFDHTTGTLYWAATAQSSTQSDSGTITVDRTFMATVDHNSGTATELFKLGDDAQVLGLYIPFTAAFSDAPAAISDFTVTPAGDGAYSATLSWTNPSETFGGSPLQSITSVDIQRDGTTIETRSGTPGSRDSFVDVIAQRGGAVHTYRIAASNSAGEGAPAEKTLFVGTDRPAAVGSPTAVRASDGSAIVTWLAPEGGADGGYTDLQAVTYTVRRLPDETVVADGLTATTVTDADIPAIDTYTYEITAQNAGGTSPAATTAPIVLGANLPIPYDCAFTEQEFKAWTIVDHDHDGNVWQRMRVSWLSADVLNYLAPRTGADADDWAVSHYFGFEEGASYKVTFDIYSYQPNNFRFFLLRDGDVDQPLQEIADFNQTRSTGYTLAPFEFTFTAEQGGDFNVALQTYSAAGSSTWYFTNFHIEKLVDVNLAATAVSGPAEPILGRTYTYNVTVSNKGKLTQDSYTVGITDTDGNLLASCTGSEAIASGAQTTVPVEWTVDNPDVTAIRGKVICPDDAVSGDDLSPETAITVQPAGSPDKIAIGSTSTRTTTKHPFDFYTGNGKGAAMSIYANSEIGMPGGRITRLQYRYSTYYDLTDIPVKVYMANTDRTSTDDGWIPEQDLTLVYDGTVTFPKNSSGGTVDIDLTTTFDYTGGNLAILTTNAAPKYYNISFTYYTDAPCGNAISWGGSAEFDFTQAPSKSYYGNSSVTMLMQCGGSTVSGTVTDEDGQPLTGVTVSTGNATAQTGTDGSFTMRHITDGTYTLTFSLTGYPDATRTVTVAGADATVNAIMSMLPQHTVSGRVLTPEGTPVGNAAITLSGYLELSTGTDDDGSFLIEGVFPAESNTLTAVKDWYSPASTGFSISDSDVELGDITLGYYHYPAVNAEAIDNGDNVVVSWQTPDEPQTVRYDNGTPSSQTGINDDYGHATIGTVFRSPMELRQVQWMTTSEGGPHNAVHLFIYDLDENGEPTSTLLHSERAIRNQDNVWHTYDLPTPIEAPRGCFVALSYPGFLGIARDNASPEYPFMPHTYAFTSDYDTPVFSYLDDKGLDSNLLLRAVGMAYPSDIDTAPAPVVNPDEKPDFRTYTVKRKNIITGEDWTAITTAPISATTFTDDSYDALNPGVYRYAVSIVYPDGTESGPALTPCIVHNMLSVLTVKAATNSFSGSAEGATVELRDADGHQFSSMISSDNTAEFSDLWKGVYNVSVTLEGYEPASTSADLSLTDELTTDELLLREIIGTPYNIAARIADDQQTVTLTWNESGTISDDFDSHPDFVVASPGTAGWRYADRDGARTFADKEYDFPGRTQAMSFIVFNPSATVPAMTMEAIQPFSGGKFLACFAAMESNDDWFISPWLNFYEPFTFRFKAKSYAVYYHDTFRVGYSESGTDPDDFIWLTDGIEATNEWTDYSFEIPAEATYVALNCISPGTDGFIFMVDDVTIGNDNGFTQNTDPRAPEAGYEVWLDGEKQADTDQCVHTLSQLTPGKHTAGVKAVYNSGESDLATIDFTISTDGINGLRAGIIRVWPNPATEFINISGEFSSACLFDLSGRKIGNYTASDFPLDVTTLTTGVYLLTVSDDSGSRIATEKVIVSH